MSREPCSSGRRTVRQRSFVHLGHPGHLVPARRRSCGSPSCFPCSPCSLCWRPRSLPGAETISRPFLCHHAAPFPCGADAGHAVSVARKSWARRTVPSLPRSVKGRPGIATVLSVSGAFLSLTYRACDALLSGTHTPSSVHSINGEAPTEDRYRLPCSEHPDATHQHIGVTTQRIILIRESHRRIEPLQLPLWPASPAPEGGRPA
jgi:hypothetical protein